MKENDRKCRFSSFSPVRRGAIDEFLTLPVRLLIRPTEIEVPDSVNNKSIGNMIDILYIGVVVLFFVVSGVYVGLCDKM